LAIQGDFQAHSRALARIGAPFRFVKKAAELVDLAGLIVPGGEPEQEVRIVVIDEQGMRTVFQRRLRPGARVTEVIRTKGYTIIQVYLQNRLVQEIRP